MTAASIVIPTRAGAHRLPTLLAALAAQDVADWEAIVVIDGDCDGSQAVVSRFAAELPVRSIVLPTNRGRVTALNTGFAAATGEVLIRCDDDLQPAPDFVRRHVAGHADRQVGVVGLCRNVLDRTTYARVYGDDADDRHRSAGYATPADQRWRLWGANVSVDRSTWQQVGPYETRFRGYGWEDVDYGYRLHSADIPIVLEPELETAHFAAAVTTATRLPRAFRSGQARQLFDQLHGAGASGPAQLPDSAWNHAVRLSARTLSYRRAALIGRGVDQAIRVLPAPTARKLVALVVEAGSVAGYDSATEVTNDF